jgi:hypothetical protein
LSTCEVNNGETPHPEPNAFIKVEAVFIGPAMYDGLAHSRKKRVVHLAIIDSSNSYNPTHGNL